MSGANPAAHDPGERRIQLGLDRLTNILWKLAPVTSVSRSLFCTPPAFVGVSYCWRFKEADSGLYSRVEETLRAFHGAMTWSFNFQFNENGACIAGLSANEKFYSPIGDSGSLRAQADRANESARVSVADEVEKLCDFMDNAFGAIQPKRESPARDPFISDDLAAPPVFDVILVRDVKKIHWPAPTSVVDKQLDFGLTYDEWYALYFEVLGKSADLTIRRPVDFQGEIPGYVILSRLNDIHDGAMVDASEVAALEMECLQLEPTAAGNSTAQRCLKKLILICKWAKDLNTGVWFSGQ